MELLITPGGEVRCVYGEVIDLHTLGQLCNHAPAWSNRTSRDAGGRTYRWCMVRCWVRFGRGRWLLRPSRNG